MAHLRRVTIAVIDNRSTEAPSSTSKGSAALDAFKHPYAFATTQRRPAERRGHSLAERSNVSG